MSDKEKHGVLTLFDKHDVKHLRHISHEHAGTGLVQTIDETFWLHTGDAGRILTELISHNISFHFKFDIHE